MQTSGCQSLTLLSSGESKLYHVALFSSALIFSTNTPPQAIASCWVEKLLTVRFCAPQNFQLFASGVSLRFCAKQFGTGLCCSSGPGSNIGISAYRVFGQENILPVEPELLLTLSVLERQSRPRTCPFLISLQSAWL